MHVALAARAGVARALAGAGDVELLVVGREAEPVGVRHLLLGDHEIERPLGIDAVAVGRQLALHVPMPGGWPSVGLSLPAALLGPPGRVGRALVELAAIGRVGEPVAAVGMRHGVVGRVQPLALEVVGQHRDRAVELVAHDAPRQVLAGQLPALEVEACCRCCCWRAGGTRSRGRRPPASAAAGCSGCRSTPDSGLTEFQAGPSDHSAPVHRRWMAALGWVMPLNAGSTVIMSGSRK